MAVLEILTAPDPRLNIKAEKVKDIESVQSLIQDMLETLSATGNGVGLASTQLGRKEAVIIVDLSKGKQAPLVLINPKIVHAENRVAAKEGCLSVPGYTANVERYANVRVSALDRKGNSITIEADSSLAIVLQHEIDHLAGHLFIDYLSPFRRSLAMFKFKVLMLLSHKHLVSA